MRVLREADVAEDVRDGRWIIYRVPEEARALLEGLVSGALRERIEISREAAGDVEKLEACLQQNIRGRVCESRPQEEGR